MVLRSDVRLQDFAPMHLYFGECTDGLIVFFMTVSRSLWFFATRGTSVHLVCIGSFQLCVVSSTDIGADSASKDQSTEPKEEWTIFYHKGRRAVFTPVGTEG